MRKKAEILRRLRDLEKELTREPTAAEYHPDIDEAKYLKDYHMNLGRVKALNWVLNRE
jgi:hypothetical protein